MNTRPCGSGRGRTNDFGANGSTRMISVVMAVDNGRVRRPLTLDALRRVAIPSEDAELAVVDNASTDATLGSAPAEIVLKRAIKPVGAVPGRTTRIGRSGLQNFSPTSNV